MINKTDKSRSSYYNYYTNKKWGAASSYNLCVDSSKLGIDGAAKAIIQAGIKTVIYDCDKYEHTPSVIASKRMMDAAGVRYYKYKRTGRKIDITV